MVAPLSLPGDVCMYNLFPPVYCTLFAQIDALFGLFARILNGITDDKFIEYIRADTVFKCTPTIQGLWTGYVQNASSGQNFSFDIMPDGTASYQDSVAGVRQLNVGTWKLTNGTWTCNITCVYGYYVGAKQTFTATYNATTGTLTNGTYVTTSPGSDSGTFTLTKVN